MGRRRRIDWPGAWHHLMNRGAGRRAVFRDDDDRRLAVSLLSEFEERFGVEVHAYCLMGNHFHVLVRSREGRVSEAMKWFGSEFTRRVNFRREVDGAIFRGRFHSVLVERDAHLIWLFRYINANPLDLGWKQPLDRYPWSGLGLATGVRKGGDWLSTDFVRSRFGPSPRRLAEFVESAREAKCSTRVGLGGGQEDAEIAAAVETASGPGPDVCSAAEIRAAHSLIAIRSGLCLDNVSTVADLSASDRCRTAERAQQRFETSDSLRRLVERAMSVLSLAADQTPANGV